MSAPLIVLVGPMGVGKSTVGQLLAERLGTGYRDTDEDIVTAQGRAIAEIFVDEGEAAFRTLEKEAGASQSSPSRNVRYSPRARSMPVLRAVASPPFRSCRTSTAPGSSDSARARRSAVPSDEQSSTRMNSKSSRAFARRLRRVSGAYCRTL